MEQCVLVLGKNYATPLGIIRALGKAGFRVELLIVGDRNVRDILSASRYVSRVYPVEERDGTQIIGKLLNEVPAAQYDYQLFPTDDFTASLIDRHREELKTRYRMPYIIGDSITRWMDKSVQSALAKETGFPAAREWIVRLDSEKPVIPDDIPFPCFVKPLISADGGKMGIAECADPGQLARKCEALKKKNHAVLVQEKLNITREYTVDGICCDQQVFIPAVIRKTRIARHNRGVTMTGVLESNDTIADSVRKMEAFLKKIRYAGMFDFELLQTADGMYFGELNLRCGGPCHAYFLNGVNLPAMAVRTLYGEPVDPEDGRITLGREFLNPKVAWEDYAHGFVSRAELNRLVREMPSLLSDPEDPEPEKCFERIIPARCRKNRRKNMVRQLAPDRLKKGLVSLLRRGR